MAQIALSTKISLEAHAVLERLAAQTGKPKAQIISDAILLYELYQREQEKNRKS